LLGWGKTQGQPRTADAEQATGPAKKTPPRASDAVPIAVLEEDGASEGIGEANVEINEGTTKLGLPCAIALAATAGTGGKPTPEAARAETRASSWPEDKDRGGMPPSMAASGTLVVEEAAGVKGRFEACSAASSCLTALTTDAKKAGEG